MAGEMLSFCHNPGETHKGIASYIPVVTIP